MPAVLEVAAGRDGGKGAADDHDASVFSGAAEFAPARAGADGDGGTGDGDAAVFWREAGGEPFLLGEFVGPDGEGEGLDGSGGQG